MSGIFSGLAHDTGTDRRRWVHVTVTTRIAHKLRKVIDDHSQGQEFH